MAGHVARHVAVDKLQTTHLPGPVNGNPYAQIDNQLRQKLRTRSVDQKETTLQQGIEDLDGILGDLGYTSLEPDANANTYYRTAYSQTKSPPVEKSSVVVKQAPLVVEGKITVEKHGTLHEAPPVQSPLMHPKSQSFSADTGKYIQYQTRSISLSSSGNNDVFRRQNSTKNGIDNLLHELDQSPLNNSTERPINGLKKTRTLTNTSTYDNDSSFDQTDEYEMTQDDSVDGEIEIKPGTVAQHIQSLNNVLFKDACAYSKKYGVPLAGINAADVVEERVTEFNSRSLAPGYRAHAINEIYHSQGGLRRVDYEKDDQDGIVLAYPAEEDEEYREKMASLLSRSDSAYGESSSSPSPVITPTSSRRHVTSDTINGNGSQLSDLTPIDTSYASKQLGDQSMTESHSPRSDVNGKSSGIGSRTSSMNSLDCDENSSFNSLNSNGRPTQHYDTSPQQKTQPQKPMDSKVTYSYSTSGRPVNTELIRPKEDHNNNSVVTIRNVSVKKVDIQPPPIDRNANVITVTSQQRNGPATSSAEYRQQSKPVTTPTLGRRHQSTSGSGETKRSLTVVEECIQPSRVQKEVESLNDDFFKNLLEEDLVRPTDDNDMPISIPYNQTNGHIHHHMSANRKENENDLLNSYDQQLRAMRSVDENFRNQQNSYEFESARSTPGTPRRFPSQNCYPDQNGGHFLGRPGTLQRTLSNGSSTASDEAISSPRSISSSGGGSGRNTLRHRRYRSSGGSSTSSISSGELFPDVIKYPNVRFDKDTMNLWYKPSITRDEATHLLKDKDPGSFVVRASQSYEGAFGLAVKVETPPVGVIQQAGGDITKVDLDNELVRHFLIEPCKKGVRLKGSNEEPTFSSLMALIYQHTLTKMALPVALVIPEYDSVDGSPQNGQDMTQLTETQLLEKGASCNLVYLGAVKVDTLTGDGAVQYSMNKVTSPNIALKTTVVNIKVTRNGITLTDNNRRMFFRKHFPMTDILHCGVDPKSRKFNLKTVLDNMDREAGCFGFVVKKHANSMENHCHIFAEMDVDQPASAVINFIHKAMRASRL